MEASTIRQSYSDWRNAVGERLDQIYCITMADGGFDEAHLIRHWQSSEAPRDFVKWFGNKYDLEPKSAFGL
jgi:hypothetical protein